MGARLKKIKKIQKLPVQEFKEIKATKENGDLSLNEQAVAEFFARGIRQHQIGDLLNLSAGRISQILSYDNVKEEIARIRDNFFRQMDMIILDAYVTGFEEWKKRTPDMSPEQLLEGLKHIEELRGQRLRLNGDGSSQEVTLSETHQKKISLGKKLENLPSEERMETLTALSKILKPKRGEHEEERLTKGEEDIIDVKE